MPYTVGLFYSLHMYVCVYTNRFVYTNFHIKTEKIVQAKTPTLGDSKKKRSFICLATELSTKLDSSQVIDQHIWCWCHKPLVQILAPTSLHRKVLHPVEPHWTHSYNADV